MQSMLFYFYLESEATVELTVRPDTEQLVLVHPTGIPLE